MKKIGIVGLGIMGRGMAVNFIKKGYEVYVWNRTKSIADGVEDAIVCDSPKKVAEKADIIFEVTANDESSEQVWTGKDGILAGADKSKVLIISATVSVKWTDKLIELCREKNLRLLDIPLTGGRIGAETAKMTFLCGGDENLIEELKPTFQAVAANILYFGDLGHGMRYKLILNFLQGVHIIAFGQAMQIAKHASMDLQKVADGLASRPGGAITEIAKNTYFQDPDPITFSIEWITKDLSYAEKFAKSMGLDLSILEDILNKYKSVLAENKDKDWASINKLIEAK